MNIDQACAGKHPADKQLEALRRQVIRLRQSRDWYKRHYEKYKEKESR